MGLNVHIFLYIFVMRLHMILSRVLKNEMLIHQKANDYQLQTENNSFIESCYNYQYKDYLIEE